MKKLYFELNMGAAGDMLTAALLDIYEKPAEFIALMNAAGLEGVTIEANDVVKCGIRGKSISVCVGGVEEESRDVESAHEHDHDGNDPSDHGHTDHGHDHHHDDACTDHDAHTHNGHADHSHSDIASIARIIENLHIPQSVKYNALSVYKIIAEAEAEAHHTHVSAVHFHEVGSLDAIADITAFCWLIELIGADEISASAVNTGSGRVLTAHGILPVPAPATELILRDVPSYSNDVSAELCTPTGAALIKHFCSSYGARPLMKIIRTGYGMGKKEFKQANCVRAFFGETEGTDSCMPNETIVELKCNIDDMSGEALGYAVRALTDGGALDVFTQSIQMKKNRPAALLTCLTTKEDAQRMVQLMLMHTTTLGVRQCICERYALKRQCVEIDTPVGKLRMKLSNGYDTKKIKVEYDDIAAFAAQKNISFSDAERIIYSHILKDG